MDAEILDYSEYMVAARNDLDPLSHALATGDYPTARTLAIRIQANLERVISWTEQRIDDSAIDVTRLDNEQRRLIPARRPGESQDPVQTDGPSATPVRDLEHRDWPICPYCGHVNDNAWKWNFGIAGQDGALTGALNSTAEGAFRCSNCTSLMIVKRAVTITYTTAQLHPRK